MSKQYDEHIIMKNLDNPFRILFWDMHDFLLMVLPLFLGMIFESLFVVAGGLIVRWVMKRASQHFPRGTLKRMAYWYFPTKTINSCLKTQYPPSHIRKYIH